MEIQYLVYPLPLTVVVPGARMGIDFAVQATIPPARFRRLGDLCRAKHGVAGAI